MAKIYIINVGTNTSDENIGIMSPLFVKENTFEFVSFWQKNGLIRYSDIKCFNSENSISTYLPEGVHSYYTHNDPEFETFTYGDLPEKNPRAANLKNAVIGDFLFFLARLVPYKDGEFESPKKGAFYLIGFLKVEEIYKTESNFIENESKIKNNAHYKRYLALGEFTEDVGRIFKGNLQESVRFKHPVLVNKNFCDKFLRDINDNLFDWDEKKGTELQRIGSYTRAIRAFIDENNNPELWRAFWKYINKNIQH